MSNPRPNFLLLKRRKILTQCTTLKPINVSGLQILRNPQYPFCHTRQLSILSFQCMCLHQRLFTFTFHFQIVDPLKKNIVHKGSSDSTSPKPSSRDALERLADLLSQRRLQDSLPLPEPETFRGDLLQYPFWVKSFKTIIEDQTHKSARRLFYLGKYTVGEAREAISGFPSLETPQAYSEAKKVLSDRFGNHFLIADTYRKKIKEWSRIQPNDGATLRKYSDFLLRCQTAAKKIRYLKILDDPDENRKMARKLP